MPKIDDVCIQGESFKVTYLRDDDFFSKCWRSLENGKGEAETFNFFTEFVNQDTTVLDIGAWIGTTGLFLARKAKKVFLFEADPVALESLQANLNVNPDINNISIIHGAVAAESGKTKIYSDAYGNNSGSSLYKTAGKSSWDIPKIDLDQFIVDQCVSEPVLVNMDIEAAEYDVIPGTSFWRQFNDLSICLSIHPQLIANSITGNGLIAKIRRRIRVVTRTWKLLSIFQYFPYRINAKLEPVTRFNICKQLLFSGRIPSSYNELFLTKRQYAKRGSD